jgi:hypothetical protein
MQITSKGFKKPDDIDNADLKVFVGENMDLLETELNKKVDVTKKASDTELGLVKIGTGITIDANGVITASGGGGGIGDINTTSAFSATQTTGQSLTATIPAKLIFETESVDNKSEYDTTLSRFVASEAGIYLFSSTMRLNASTGAEVFLSFYKNGVQHTRVQQFTNDGAVAKAVQAHGNLIIKLSAGDYIEVYGYSSNAVATAGYAVTGYHTTYFTGVRIA